MIDNLDFKSWVKRFPGRGQPGSGAVVVFPHAGGAAAAYRKFAIALADNGVDTFLLQYPQRAERLAHPAPATLEQLAEELFAAGEWTAVGPLRLFGHCMGANVAFEFARVAESKGVAVQELWASAGQAPCTVAESLPVPSTDPELLADMVDLGGTDPRLLDDEDFVELLLMAVRADYQAFNRYSCARDVRIAADIHAVGGSGDHRISDDQLQSWHFHTSGAFTSSTFDGGHFYLHEHVEVLAELIT